VLDKEKRSDRFHPRYSLHGPFYYADMCSYAHRSNEPQAQPRLRQAQAAADPSRTTESAKHSFGLGH
jgi:hypothetical protein